MNECMYNKKKTRGTGKEVIKSREIDIKIKVKYGIAVWCKC